MKKQVTKSEYVVEDILNNEMIIMVLPGKYMMNGLILNIGEKVYVTVNSINTCKGRLTTETEFKEYDELSKLRTELEERVKE